MARIDVIEKVNIDYPNKWSLYFQWCKYIYDDEKSEFGYRFIWKDDDGKFHASRGQARIPSLNDMNILISKAKDAGWLGIVENQINE